MSEPQDPEPRAPRVTPPEWETTEFPAFLPPPDAQGQFYGSSALPYESFDQPYDAPYEYGQPVDPNAQPGYAGQPGYGPQPGVPPQNGYPGQSGYGTQPGFPAAGHPAPGQPGDPLAPWGQSPPPPKQNRTRVVLGVVAALVVAGLVAGGLALFAGGSAKTDDGKDTAGRTITLPTSAAGLTKVSGFDTDALKQQLGTSLQSSGASSTGSAQNAQIGVYSKGGSGVPALIFVAIALKDVPELTTQVNQLGIDAAVLKFVNGASQTASGATPKSYSAGTLGGAMYCATGTISVESVANCGWGDRSYFALTIVVDPSTTDAAADTTRTFRAAAEH